ncbi:MAG: DNA cytosine methyltransferase [Flavipsychrobacter sp.]
MSKRKAIPIIDLFAGPGGLGEGFMSSVDANNERYFKIALSIEKDDFAHETLTLRSFLRQFEYKVLPDEYYSFLRGEITKDELYEQYPDEIKIAREEAWKTELGTEKAPHELVDKRIRKALNGEKNFVLIGGPPCQAYSLVGRARRQEGEGLNENDPRVYLYREYYRILAIHNPPVFVMENVKGLLSSKVNNESIFQQVIADLQDPLSAYKKLHGKDKLPFSCPGYNIYSLVKHSETGLDLFSTNVSSLKPKDFIIHSEDYGIPQTRHRVILLGVRKDINVVPETMHPYKTQIGVENVLSGLPSLRSGLSKTEDTSDAWKRVLTDLLRMGLSKQIDTNVWHCIQKSIDSLSVPLNDRGGSFVYSKIAVNYKPSWYLDKKINGAINHESRSHIPTDLYRYIFASCFAEVHNRSPKLSDFPVALLPHHSNVNVGISENKFADRFRVQLKGIPSKTITSHISKDGHYYIHPDPKQCRSLTVREAARIQTFPDNYFFCGPRTEQYHQVGNAVPPYLAYQIAEVVKKTMQQNSIS